MSKVKQRTQSENSCEPKKSKKVKKAKKLKEKLQIPQSSGKQQKALLYLQSWAKKEESGWKFNKSDQVWLLRNWKNEKLLSEELFPLFAEYVKGLADESKAKASLLDDAKVTVNNEDESSDSKIATERSRFIIQSIS